MTTDPERAARTEQLFRKVNEAIAETADGGEIQLICECDDPACTDRLRVPAGQYDRVRRRDSCFLVDPDHVDPAVEHVVEAHPGYTIVEKPILA